MNYRITTSQHAGLVHTYPDIFENWDFFLRFSLVSARQRRFRAPETQVFENGPQRGVFWKTTADRFHADGQKRKLSNHDDVIHHNVHALQGLLSYFHLSSVFVRRDKNDSNTIRVDKALHCS